MSKKDKAWAKEELKRIIEELGGKCVHCGSKYRLQVDHIHGRDWRVEDKGSDTRVRIYRIEMAKGLLQVLCISCNSSKGDPEDPVDTSDPDNMTQENYAEQHREASNAE